MTLSVPLSDTAVLPIFCDVLRHTGKTSVTMELLSPSQEAHGSQSKAALHADTA